MPRRGEYNSDFPLPQPRLREPQRVGLREVIVADGRGVKSPVVVDPSKFTCSALVGELADEWVELVEAMDYKLGTTRGFRNTIREFCTFVDSHVARPGEATLAHAEPDLHRAVTEWVRGLPASFTAGSRAPALHAGRLRRLIKRRIEHPARPVVGHLTGWVKGSIGLRRGQTQELDEFTRVEKLALVKAAWADLVAVEARIKAGWALAASGVDPAVGGWLEPANLLWAIAHDAWPTQEICRRLPRKTQWPPALAAFMPPVRSPRGLAGQLLLCSLVRQLFPHNLDLHCFRILLMAATGRSSEEVSGLDEDDIEFGPRSVMIDFTKNRAHAESRRSYDIDATLSQAVVHPARPRLDPADLIRRLLDLSRPLAARQGLDPVPLFLRASVINAGVLQIKPFLGSLQNAKFTTWLNLHGVSVSEPRDIRRLRKSGKVEKAIAFRGRVSDIADDHSQETFHGHYAHGTTLRVIAGKVITSAQQRWFTQATEGPAIFDEEAARALGEPEAGAALGLSAQEVDDLRSGQLDMGVCNCKDPRQSPFGKPGQLCPVAPLRCFECRNALVLPSNLPQMLLFADHLERLKMRLSPRHFDAYWRQSRVNLLAALDARSDAEIAQARRQIAEDGLALQLPLSAHVEFDS
ncbi:hypothetical protein ABZZ36_43920 [Actinacidiphila glaucinigra]|uniref:hypothetical protein n=1 Tax=Actinacidiphila glaucinigra TaxID=235986 RepID=UPI0033B489F6